MPDNKNPPGNDQAKKPEGEEEKISRVGKVVKCNQRYCTQPALSLSSYCWEHTEDKKEYRKKIQDWANAGKSMESFILTGADLSKFHLDGANISKSLLWKTNFSNARLSGTNFSEARLMEANLSGAWLDGAKLYKVVLWGANLLGARISGANLSEAGLAITNMSETWLDGAKLYNASLIAANLSKAVIIRANLTNAQLNWVNLTDIKGLTYENFSKYLTEEEKKFAKHFKGSYQTLKNHFYQSGLYDDASWAAFRERTLERIAWYKETKLQELKDLFSWNNWKTAFRWSRSVLMNLLCGYGEKPWKAVASSVIIVIAFFLFYLVSNCIKANPPEVLRWWDYLYFSIVTFTTLGYGDIRPLAAPWARMVASGEAFIGAFMIALFVWTLARRYVAR